MTAAQRDAGSFPRPAVCLPGLETMLLISAIVTGLAVGSMYGLIALGYHVTYVVSNTVNFSQGSSMMLGAVLGYTFAIRLGWPLPLAVAMALLLCALFGLVVERFLVRPFAERGSNGWLMATVAGGIVLDNIVLFTFGKEPRAFPSILAQKPIELFGAGVFPLQLVIPLVGLGITVALSVAFHRTKLGKALLAVVQNKDAARLMGINVRVAIALSFALSTGARGSCRTSDRAAVQHAFGHGHAVRHQGLCGRDPWRHYIGVRRDAGRLSLRTDRSAGHRLRWLDLYADRRLHRRDRRTCRDAERAARPRGDEEGVMMLARRLTPTPMTLAIAALTGAGALLVFGTEGYTHFIIALVALDGGRRRRTERAARLVRPGVARPCRLLRHRRLHGGDPDREWRELLAGISAGGPPDGRYRRLLALPALRASGPYLAMITIAFAFIVQHGTIEWKTLTGGQNGLMGLVSADTRRPSVCRARDGDLRDAARRPFALYLPAPCRERLGQGDGRGARQ